MNSIRANDLEVGDTYDEFGTSEEEHVTIEKIDYHGDRVLITGTSGDGCLVETSFDIDTVVELVNRP